ncbi:unnamed protein product [Ixodes pacificus]
MLDSVHLNKKGNRVFGRILRGVLRGLVAGHEREAEDQEWSRHAAEEEHQELRRQCGDQTKEFAEFWNVRQKCFAIQNLASLHSCASCLEIHSLLDPEAAAERAYCLLGLLQGKRACLIHGISVFTGSREPGSRIPQNWLLCPSVVKTHHQVRPAHQESTEAEFQLKINCDVNEGKGCNMQLTKYK